MKGLLAVLGAAALASWAIAAGAGGGAPTASRIEARSSDLLAVGLVSDDRMSIHLSRLIDNAPVQDAVVTVVLRGVSLPTTAQADGSYSLQSKELGLPGSAAVKFVIAQPAGPAHAAATENIEGTLRIADATGRSEDKNGARQLWWWVLNFAVCIGFLLLISRRRKNAQD